MARPAGMDADPQEELERSLTGQGRELAQRLRRAQDYHEVVRRWAAANRPGLDRTRGAERLPPGTPPPRLSPFARPAAAAQVFYSSPGGGFTLTLAQARSIGRPMFEAPWLDALCQRSPMQEAMDLGLFGAPRSRSVVHMLGWLEANIRSDWPEYVAGCLDMYFAGVAVRRGILPGVRPAPVGLPCDEDVEWARGVNQRLDDLERKAQDAADRAKVLQAFREQADWDVRHPAAAFDRDLRERLADYEHQPNLPRLSQAGTPRTLTQAELDRLHMRTALRTYAVRKNMLDMALKLAGGMTAGTTKPLTMARVALPPVNRGEALAPAIRTGGPTRPSPRRRVSSR